MEQHVVDIYCGKHFCGQGLDVPEPQVAAKRVIEYLETFYTSHQSIPWKKWFDEQFEQTHGLVEKMHLWPSYDIYSEHFFAGMPYWRDALVLSNINILALASHGYNILDETWHAVGQRDEGTLLKTLVDKLKTDAACNIRVRSATAGIDLYTGEVDAYVHAYRTGENTRLAEDWCRRACKEESFETWRMFCNRYPDMGVLLVHSLAFRMHSEESRAFAQHWLAQHPQQHEALCAFLNSRAALGKEMIAFLNLQDMDEKTRDNSSLMRSIFPDITAAADYLRMYHHIFFSSRVNETMSLPEGLQP